jgi:hypothetical protein
LAGPLASRPPAAPQVPLPLVDRLEPRRLLSTTIYVDASSPGPTRNGAAWKTAYADLQQALAAAAPGDTVRVADGTYKPTAGTDRTATFQLKSGVTLLGGFAGYGAPNPDLRDVAANRSTLSGDLGTVNNINDNTFHVVTASGTDATAVLDGFVVTRGAAGATASPDNVGGGLYAANASPTVRNCSFLANYAYAGGGAVYDTAASPTFFTCVFVGNRSGNNTGHAIFNISSAAAKIVNCTFAANTAPNALQLGSAIYNAGTSSATVTNSVLSAGDTPIVNAT